LIGKVIIWFLLAISISFVNSLKVSEVRLKLAEYQSEKEIIQKQFRIQAEEEAEKIHSKYV